jgi:hypothetical protein
LARGLTLDAGALIAADRDDRRFWAYWRRALELGVVCTVPSPALAQAWRGPRNARLASLLAGCRVEPLTEPLARRAGELCGRSGTADIVDAAVVVSAASRGDEIVTSDVADIRRLVDASGRRLVVLAVNQLA